MLSQRAAGHFGPKEEPTMPRGLAELQCLAGKLAEVPADSPAVDAASRSLGKIAAGVGCALSGRGLPGPTNRTPTVTRTTAHRETPLSLTSQNDGPNAGPSKAKRRAARAAALEASVRLSNSLAALRKKAVTHVREDPVRTTWLPADESSTDAGCWLKRYDLWHERRDSSQHLHARLAWSELGMYSEANNVYRATIRVIGRVGNMLIVEADP